MKIQKKMKGPPCIAYAFVMKICKDTLTVPYLSGTVLFKGLKRVELVGVTLLESELDAGKDDQRNHFRLGKQITGPTYR